MNEQTVVNAIGQALLYNDGFENSLQAYIKKVVIEDTRIDVDLTKKAVDEHIKGIDFEEIVGNAVNIKHMVACEVDEIDFESRVQDAIEDYSRTSRFNQHMKDIIGDYISDNPEVLGKKPEETVKEQTDRFLDLERQVSALRHVILFLLREKENEYQLSQINWPTVAKDFANNYNGGK